MEYVAFLSYSSVDQKMVRWIQREIENWRLDPKHVGRTSMGWKVPKILRPVFRDRDNLAPGHSIDQKIRNALGSSKFLIVCCSPNAAKSSFINQEIEFFKSLGRDDLIIPVILSGEPGSDELNPFPSELLRRSNGRPITPLAADMRTVGDGPRRSIAKIVAGMIGVDFDEIWQRHQRRRARQRIYWAAAVTFVSVSIGLIYHEFQRTVAEERVEALAAQSVNPSNDLLPEQRLLLSIKALQNQVDGGPMSPNAHLSFWQALDQPFPLSRWALNGVATAAAFNSSNEKFITGDDQGRIQLYTLSDGNIAEIREFSLPPVKFIVSGSDRDFTILTDTGAFSIDTARNSVEKISTDMNIQHPVRGVYSPDGERLALISNDGTLQLFDSNLSGRYKAISSILGPSGLVEFSPGGDRLLATSGGDTPALYLIASVDGRLLIKSHEHTRRIRDIEFNNSGNRFATTANDGRALLWNSKNGEVIGTPMQSTGEYNHDGLLFSPDDRKLVTYGSGSEIQIWDAQTGNLEAELKRGHVKNVSAASFSEFGRVLITGDSFGRLVKWSLDDNEPFIEQIGMDGEITQILANEFGAMRSVAVSNNGVIKFWNRKERKAYYSVQLIGGKYSKIKFSDDMEYFFSYGGDRDNSGVLYRVDEGSLLNKVLPSNGTAPREIEYSLDGEKILIQTHDDKVFIGDSSRERLGELKLIRANASYATFGGRSDELFVSIGGDEPVIELINHHSGEVLRSYVGHKQRSDKIIVTDSWIVAHGEFGGVTVWNRKSGQATTPFFGEPFEASSVAISGNNIYLGMSDGRMLTSSIGNDCGKPGSDGRDLESCMSLEPRLGDSVYGLSTSFDGAVVAAWSFDDEIVVWNRTSGKFLPIPYTEPINDFSLSEDGRYILISSYGLSVIDVIDNRVIWEKSMEGNITTHPEKRILVFNGRHLNNHRKFAATLEFYGLQIFDEETKKATAVYRAGVFTEETNEVRYEISRDETIISSMGEDSWIRYWPIISNPRQIQKFGMRLINGGCANSTIDLYENYEDPTNPLCNNELYHDIEERREK